MKHGFILLVVAAVACVAGCSRGPASLARNSKAFDSAPAAVRDSWNKAVACVQTNGYVGAVPLLFGLRSQPLTLEQSAAVEAVLKPVTDALYAAADRGDPAAMQAIAELKKRPRH